MTEIIERIERAEEADRTSKIERAKCYFVLSPVFLVVRRPCCSRYVGHVCHNDHSCLVASAILLCVSVIVIYTFVITYVHPL